MSKGNETAASASVAVWAQKLPGIAHWVLGTGYSVLGTRYSVPRITYYVCSETIMFAPSPSHVRTVVNLPLYFLRCVGRAIRITQTKTTSYVIGAESPRM